MRNGPSVDELVESDAPVPWVGAASKVPGRTVDRLPPFRYSRRVPPVWCARRQRGTVGPVHDEQVAWRRKAAQHVGQIRQYALPVRPVWIVGVHDHDVTRCDRHACSLRSDRSSRIGKAHAHAPMVGSAERSERIIRHVP
eukprot:7384732-Prymnesium_polylepis.3